MNVRVGGNQARVVGLLYRGPAFDLHGRESFDVRYGSAESAMLDAPREIARGVSEMVDRVPSSEGMVQR